MRDEAPSATALRVAALRALHQRLERPPILVDPLAERILDRIGAELLAEHARNPVATARLRTTLAVRSRVAEEAVAESVAHGVDQCVILGAGLDTFAYRHGHRDLTTFELDHPATQTWKRSCLRAAGISEPARVRYASANLLHDDLMRTLAAVGLAASRPAIFVMLGVVGYIEISVLSAIFRAIAASCVPGSEIVFDYTEPYLDKPAAVRAIYEAVARRVAALGEPWVTCIEPDAAGDLLRAEGFSMILDLGAPALEARFLAGRGDDLAVAPLVHLVQARLTSERDGCAAPPVRGI